MSTTAERENGEKDTSRLRALVEIGKALNGALEVEEAFSRILGILSQKMSMKRGGVLVMNPESNSWEMRGAHGLSAEEMKRRKEYFGSGVVQGIREKGQMAAVANGGEEIWLVDGKGKTAGWKRANISFLCAPIRNQGAVATILGVDRFYEEPVTIGEDFLLLGEVCSQISEAMAIRQAMSQENRLLLEENWGLRKELETLGRTVPKARRKISLTELLEERLSQVIADIKVDPRSKCRLYDDVLFVVERTLLKSALEKTKNVQLKTARFLGINRNTLRRKIKELGIESKEK
jgi:transcriptional regulator with GAF, ATPase, and Fis domain